jgi:hypothetical protein
VRFVNFFNFTYIDLDVDILFIILNEVRDFVFLEIAVKVARERIDNFLAVREVCHA